MIENNSLSEIKKVTESILKNEVIERHSLFQLQCFILAKEPTIQGKLQQCLREIKSRNQSLFALELEIEEQKDKLKLIEIELEEVQYRDYPFKTEIEKIKAEINIRSIQRRQKSIAEGLKNLEKKEKDILEELQFFCSAFDQLNRREKLKSWDDIDVQKEYWTEKLRFEVNTRLTLRQLPDVELLKTILCLHDDSQIKKGVVEMLRKANADAAQKQVS